MRILNNEFKSLVSDAIHVSGSLEQELIFSIDSRTITSTEIFIPFKGQLCDGHEYVLSALEKCAGAFVSHEYFNNNIEKLTTFKNKLIIAVQNPSESFFKLTHWWRSQFSIPIIGVTGSLGKTSTKMYIEHVLSYAGKKILGSVGNNNTLIGISLRLAHLSSEHECAVFEMGIQKKGEMEKLVALVRPTIAVITSVGHSHLEYLGSLESVALEKKKIFSLLEETNIGIINGDSPYLNSHSYHHLIIKCGQKKYNHFQMRAVKVKEGTLSCKFKMYEKQYLIEFESNHQAEVYGSLFAAAVAHQLGIKNDIIVEALRVPLHRNRRFEKKPLQAHNSFLIDDAYNASPESTKAALVAFDSIAWQGKKIVVLGDMKELGEKSPLYHRKIGRLFSRLLSVDHLILVGNQVEYMKHVLPKMLHVDICYTLDEAQKILDSLIKPDTLVLFKASGSMKFIELVDYFAVSSASSVTIKSAL